MSDLGYYALRLALVVSAVGTFAGVYAGISQRRDWCRVAERAVLVLALFATLAISALFYAFATLDFQLGYVAGHVARAMDLEYRIAALWGGQAGSLVLWLWLLTKFSRMRKKRQLTSRVAETQGISPGWLRRFTRMAPLE